MKKVFSILVLMAVFASLLRAQESSGQSVELPSFVITGEEKYELPKAAKAEAPLLPIVSEEFLKPVFSPEFLETSLQSDPIRKEMRLQDSIINYSSKLEASMGNLKTPEFNFSTIYPYNSMTLVGNLKGFNQRAYETGSGKYGFHPEAGVRLKVVEEGAFFNDNDIQVLAGYNFLGYKLWALTPMIERKTGEAYIKGSLSSSKSNFWQYSIAGQASSLSMTDEKGKETELILDLNAGFSGKVMQFTPGIQYIGSVTKNENLSKHLGFFRVNAPLQLNISDVVNIAAGGEFFHCDTINSFLPKASIAVKLKKGLILYGEYNPVYEKMGLKRALNENSFFNVNQFVPVYYPLKNRITIGMNLEYEREFDMMLSFVSFTSDRYPYFQLDSSRNYTVQTSDIKGFQTKIETRIYPGRLGYFYASLTFQSIQNDSDKYLPFVPSLQGTLSYGYTIMKGLNAKAGVIFENGRYIDALNNISLNTYVSTFLELGYSFSHDFFVNFKINNLINKENYFWRYYKEPPLNATAGITLQW
ncbi:MAG: TonB-dependent receptor [Ignavibacteria bacterium]|nr:TonB-dependent receptor [Ignavibacteria bacterium]